MTRNTVYWRAGRLAYAVLGQSHLGSSRSAENHRQTSCAGQKAGSTSDARYTDKRCLLHQLVTIFIARCQQVRIFGHKYRHAVGHYIWIFWYIKILQISRNFGMILGITTLGLTACYCFACLEGISKVCSSASPNLVFILQRVSQCIVRIQFSTY